jgi:hypothetical protein
MLFDDDEAVGAGDNSLDVLRLVSRSEREMRWHRANRLVLIQRQVDRLGAVAGAAFADEGNQLIVSRVAMNVHDAFIDCTEENLIARARAARSITMRF